MVWDFTGEGCFSKVTICMVLITLENVAIKIHKKTKDYVIQRGVAMLEAIGALDPHEKNIVKFMDNFRNSNLSCLAFKMLDRSLWDLMKERKRLQLSLNEIRPVTHQLLVAFEALKSIGIVHTDLKPDNIMLVNHKDQPFKIKLIDFGLALPVSQVEVGMVMQANSYRAPEVTLGLPLSESVDMWGVGCVMAFMYFGMNLFPGNCTYHWMKTFLHLFGQPDDHKLTDGKYSWMYFTLDEDEDWRLRTPEEYEEVTGVKPLVFDRVFDLCSYLEDAVKRCPAKRDDVEYEDRMAFLDLLKCCLHPDTDHRITPMEALKHHFITMVHLGDELETSSYTEAALQFMTVTREESFDESDYDSSYEESDSEKCCCNLSNTALTTDSQKEPSSSDKKRFINFFWLRCRP
ncbi:homeodomain-interacting protein kinase 2-like [Trachinotus anak]|uniref:homeodomain-interacting protein kinase 2-like n=1 Tax=Trachinotus anak TaxID=443729 RepID=UPI0039F22FD3